LGALEWQTGYRIYLDTNLLIYAVEEIAPFAEQVRPLFQAADRGDIWVVTSLLTLAETLVMPYRKRDDVLIATYRELLTNPPPGLHVAQLDAAVLERAARLRAATNSLRLPDAIHLATAEAQQCDLFLTNDRRLSAGIPLPVVVLGDETPS
jgi:predicted nucleic acid-binding protein